MLKDLEFHTTIPVKDLARARQYYADKLGLTPARETPGGLVYEGKGGWFLLFPSAGAGTSQSTQMGWETDDLQAVVSDLKSRGVVFMEYDLPNFKTVNSIASVGVGYAAWFKDSEGNILGIVQMGA